MTNQRKAIELAGFQEGINPIPTQRFVYDKCLEMAEWKEQQFAEEKKQWLSKAHNWLIKNSSKYVGFDESQFLAYAYKTMSDDFIKYMEE